VKAGPPRRTEDRITAAERWQGGSKKEKKEKKEGFGKELTVGGAYMVGFAMYASR
jgi:hypothetical protein